MNAAPGQQRTVASIAAISSVFGIILQLTGTIAGISAVAYFVGWRQNRAYYSELGCTWFMSLLPASDTIQTAIPVFWILAVTSFLQFELFLKGKATPKYFARFALVCSLLGGGLSLLPQLFSKHLQMTAIHVLALIAGGLFLWAAGSLIAELLARFIESDRNWRPEHLSLVYVIVTMVLWYAPDLSGRASADADSDPAYTSLPEVALVDSKPDQRWRLIHSIEGHFLVGTFGLKAADRRFRLVEQKEVKDIRPEKGVAQSD